MNCNKSWPTRKPKETLGTLVIVFLILYASLCLAQGEFSQLINSLSHNPKLIRPQDVLEDFLQGKATTRVIVNLTEIKGLRDRTDFNDVDSVKTLEGAVQVAQDWVIKLFDSSQVRVTNRFPYIFAFSAEVTLEGLKALTEIGEVVSISKDHILKVHLKQGIPLINATTVRSTYDGSGVSIAICNTGIDYTHPRLGGGSFPNNKVIGGHDCGDDDNDPMDGRGHGTCCAGIAAGSLGTVGDYIGGVAPDARLYAVKIAHGSTGEAYTSDMIEGWQWCVTHRNDDPNNPIKIISTSFGGGYHTSWCDSEESAMTKAAEDAVKAGIVLFVSSGNDGFCDGTSWPACITHINPVGAVYDANIGRHPPYPDVGCISQYSCAGYDCLDCPGRCYVDATTSADQVITYSNTATFLGLFAPSHNATTTDITGSDGYSTGDYYSEFGGTSAACPYAAGAAACLQNAAKSVQGSFLSPGEIRYLFTSTGDPVTDTKHGEISITKPRVNLGDAFSALDTAVYVDGNWAGLENGTRQYPFNTVSEGVNTVSPSGILFVRAGDYTGAGNVPISFEKAMTIKSYEGTAIIGDNISLITLGAIKISGSGELKIY